MSKKKKIKKLTPEQETAKYVAFLERALASENFKKEIEEDETGKKQIKYDKYKRSLEKERLKAKFKKMDGK